MVRGFALTLTIGIFNQFVSRNYCLKDVYQNVLCERENETN